MQLPSPVFMLPRIFGRQTVKWRKRPPRDAADRKSRMADEIKSMRFEIPAAGEDVRVVLTLNS